MANSNYALDLDLFDTAKNGYIPAEQPQRRRIQRPELLKETPISRKTEKLDEKHARIYAIKVCAFVLFTLLIIGSLIYSRVILTNLQVELNAAQKELSATQSEYTSLQMKYNSLLALDKVEEYARNELGMVKLENNQIRYFDMSGSDGTGLAQ